MKEMKRELFESVTWVLGIVLWIGSIQSFSQALKNEKPRRNQTRNIAVKGLTFELVCIPGGEFVMGSNTGEDEVSQTEKPAHRVQVKSFEMAKTEVTVRQFRTFVEATGYQTDAEKDEERGHGIFIRRWSPNPGFKDWGFKPDGSWRNPDFVQSDDDPVVGLSWNDAIAFCQWLSK